MPVRPTYPGVYIEEVASGVRTIVGVSTSSAAFIDGFDRGPSNVALQIFGMADFTREYGGLDRNSPASYAIRQFFENGGSEAFVVRVVRTTGAAGEVAVAASGALNTSAGQQLLTASAGRRLRGISAADHGDWGNNIHLEVDYDTATPGSGFNLTVSEVLDVNGRREVQRTETFRNLVATAGQPTSAIDVVNEGSKLVQLGQGTAFAGGGRPAPAGHVSGALANQPLAAAGTIDFSIAMQGRPANQTTALSVAKPAGSSWASMRPAIEAAIRNVPNVNANIPAADREVFTAATVTLLGTGGTAPAGAFRLAITPGRPAVGFNPALRFVFTGADAATADDDGLRLTDALADFGPAWTRLANGVDGTMPVPDAALLGNPAIKTGLYALDDVDLFNILCIPRAADLADSQMRAVYAAAISYCERRRAMLLVDIPETTDTLQDAQDWMTANSALRHRNAAVYFPRLRMPDPLNGNRPRAVGPSGTVAGLWARTDGARGVWKAPAGTDARLRNVDSLAYLLTDLENGVLNPLGVNALRIFPIYGPVCWGSRTLEGADALASDYKYVPVRRFTLFLEESLFRGTQWAVFEPNDEPLWAQIRLNLGAFMQSLFRQGAFQGQTPREAYFVKCDRETTTQDDINRGIVNIVVGFAPLKPAEFVILRIQQMAGQIAT